MPQIIPIDGVTARVVLLDAAGLQTTVLPDGATPVWTVDSGAFVVLPAADGLSARVHSAADTGITGKLTFAAGALVADADITQAGQAAEPAPAPTPAPAPGVAVSVSIAFDSVAAVA